MGITSLYISVICGITIQVLIIELNVKCIKHFTLANISKKSIKKLLKFSLPIGISTVSYWLLNGFTKVFITKNLGISENGIYSIAVRLTAMIILLVNIFQFAWHEMSYDIADDKNNNYYFCYAVNMIFKTVLISGLIILPILSIVFDYIIDKQYKEVYKIVPFVMTSVMLSSISGFLGTIFLAKKKTFIFSISTFLGASINILFTPILISFFKLEGAIIALNIAFLSIVLLRNFYLNKYKIYLNKKEIILIIPFLFITVSIYYTKNNIINGITLLFNTTVSLVIFKDLLILLILKIKEHTLKFLRGNL